MEEVFFKKISRTRVPGILGSKKGCGTRVRAFLEPKKSCRTCVWGFLEAMKGCRTGAERKASKWSGGGLFQSINWLEIDGIKMEGEQAMFMESGDRDCLTIYGLRKRVE